MSSSSSHAPEAIAIPHSGDAPAAHANHHHHHRSLSFSFASAPPLNLPTGSSFASSARPVAAGQPVSSPSAGAPAAPSSTFGVSPSSSSVLSSNSPITPSPILASALSLPSAAGYNPFFSTSPKSSSVFPTSHAQIGSQQSFSQQAHTHARSFSMAGGAGVGKPIVVSGFAGLSSPVGGSAVDDDEESPPSSSFNLPLQRASQQPASTAAGSQAGIKLPAQVQQMVKPPTNIGNGSSNGAKGPVAGEGRGHGVLRRLSMGANSLLSRPNLAPAPASAVPSPTVASASMPVAVEMGIGSGLPAEAGRSRGMRKASASGGTGKKRGISPTGERILQGHF